MRHQVKLSTSIPIKKLRLCACFLALSGSANTYASENALGLKGFELGFPMATCPEETLDTEALKGGAILCKLPISTLGGEPVDSFSVQIFEGRISAVVALMSSKGRGSSHGLIAALRLKYGRETLSKPHIEEYRWQQGPLVLKVDAYRGLVIAVDTSATATQTRRTAEIERKDL